MTVSIPQKFARSRIVIATALIPLAASAGNLSFLASSPAAHFKGEDYELMMKTLNTVLESTDPHASAAWSNSKTGSGGMAHLRSQFVATDGASCKRVRVENHAGGTKAAGIYTLCRYPGRGWLAHPDAEPSR